MRKRDLDNPYQQAGFANLCEVMDHLKRMRRSKKITQKQLADGGGLSVSIISKYENKKFPTRLIWFAAYLHYLGYKMVVIKDVDDV